MQTELLTAHTISRIADTLRQRYGVDFATLPLASLNPNTEYLISRDGKHVFMLHQFINKLQILRLRIYPPHHKKGITSPWISLKTSSGCSHLFARVSAAVWCAFVTRSELPKFKIYHRDGNPENCRLENLYTAVERTPRFSHEVTGLLSSRYSIVSTLQRKFPSFSLPDIDDAVSDAYIDLCIFLTANSRHSLSGLWYNFAKQRLMHLPDTADTPIPLESLCRPLEPSCTDTPWDFDPIQFLPPQLRTTAELLADGCTQAEISRAMSVNPKTVYKRTKEIRQHLSQIYQQPI